MSAAWPRHPLLYEIDTWPWLHDLCRKYGRNIALGNIPPAEWDAIAALGFDAVWLMGVWERSPASVAVSMRNAGLAESLRTALPGFRPEDNVGSAFSVRRYVADRRLGGPAGLAAARQSLADRGLRLLLDFVPNHAAHDSPWTTDHPEYFVPVSAEEHQAQPEHCAEVGSRVFACGRDPNFPPWTDVLQLNAFHPALRAAAIETLRGIAAQCDGVRCDMAMLLVNDVFHRTWGARVGPPPPTEYWADVLGPIRAAHPGFLFVAEVYWDLERALAEQGFDFCYDKTLYDRLRYASGGGVRQHLLHLVDIQQRLVRFTENHDEDRAVSAIPGARGRAAAVISTTLPGLRLLHEGQLEGRTARLPVFLARRPAEEPVPDLSAFYRNLLQVVSHDVFKNGDWRLSECEAIPGAAAPESLLAWCWWRDGERRVVAVNFAGQPAAGRVQLPWTGLDGTRWAARDLLSGRDCTLHAARPQASLSVTLPAFGFSIWSGFAGQ